MKSLNVAMEKWDEIADDVYESRKINYEKYAVGSDGTWTSPTTEDAFNRFVKDSQKGADSLYALKIEVKRQRILPWHNSLEYAREDLEAMISAFSEFYAGVYWEFDPAPEVKFPDNSEATRTIEVSFASFRTANPRPNPFFDIWLDMQD